MNKTTWQRVKLGEVAEIKYGKSHQILKNGRFLAYGSGGIIRKVDSCIYDKESVLIPRKGSLNNIFYTNKPFWVVDTMFYTIINNDIIVPKFLFYCLKIIDFDNLNVGSAVPSLTIQILDELRLCIPPLETQHKIAELLSSLDDKIDLLHRQNKTLESLALTLFRHTFIDNPNRNAWEIGKLGDYVKIELGGTPNTAKSEYWGGDIAWINSGEINKFRIIKPTKTITKLGFEKSNTKLLPKGSVVIAITGATLGQVSLLEIDSCANQSVVGVIPNDDFSSEFLYLWIKFNIDKIILNQTGGAQQHINKNDIANYPIIKPSKEFLANINLKIYFNKISHNMKEIQNLESLRDIMLPKLLSGEMEIKGD